jgi:hypothetical protein
MTEVEGLRMHETRGHLVSGKFHASNTPRIHRVLVLNEKPMPGNWRPHHPGARLSAGDLGLLD